MRVGKWVGGWGSAHSPIPQKQPDFDLFNIVGPPWSRIAGLNKLVQSI